MKGWIILSLIISLVTNSFSLNKDRLDEKIKLADELREEEKFMEAQNLLEKALIEFTENKDQKEIRIKLADIHFAWGESLKQKYEYTKSISQFQKALNIDKIYRKKDMASDINEIGIAYYKLGQFEKAIKFFENSLAVYRKIKDKKMILAILNNKGFAYKNLSLYEKAIEIFSEALEFSRILNDRKTECQTLNNLGEVYIRISEFKKSIRFYKEALIISKEIQNREEEAYILKNMGVVQLYLHNGKKAFEYLDRALLISREIKHLSLEGTLLHLIGAAHFNLFQYEDSIEYFIRGLEVSKKIKNLHLESAIFINLGVIYGKTSRFQKAIEMLKKALQIAIKIESSRAQSYCLTNLGTIYKNIYQFEKAESYFKQAHEIFKKNRDRYGEVKNLFSWGGLYRKFSRNDEAINIFLKALEFAKEINNKLLEADCLESIGILYRELKKYKKSLDYFDEAVKIIKETRINFSEASIYNNLGELHFSIGKHEMAENCFLKSIAIYSKIKLKNSLAETRINLSYTYIIQNRREEAIHELEKALLLKDQIRYELKEKDFKSSFFESYLDIYNLLFKLYYERGKLESAFSTAEKSKSVVFSEMMAKRGAREQIAGRNKEFHKLLKEETLILRKISEARTSIKDAQKDKFIKLSEEISELDSQLTEIQSKMRKRFPDYMQLLYPKGIGIEDLQKILKKNETYISYYLLDDYSVVFIATKNDIKTKKIDISKKWLESRLGTLRKKSQGAFIALQKVVSGNRLSKSIYNIYASYPEESFEIYKKLFVPIKKYIKTKYLIISSDGVLYGFPFEALVSKPIKNIPFDKKVIFKQRQGNKALFSEFRKMYYLGDDYKISYLPSANILKIMRSNKIREESKGLIAYADPIFSPNPLDDERVSGKDIKAKDLFAGRLYVQDRAIRSWPPRRLKASADEARFFQQQIGNGKVYTGFDARESKVWDEEVENARYLLFSTHGVLSKEASSNMITEPALILTLVNNPEGYDGLLGISEAAGLRLNSDVVILSACSSAGENGRGGEGFVGMARSFLFAGSKAVIASHWKVEDQATLCLMKEYSKMIKNKGLLEALSIAKKKMRKKITRYGENRKLKVSYAHPFFWSAFVLVGDSGEY